MGGGDAGCYPTQTSAAMALLKPGRDKSCLVPLIQMKLRSLGNLQPLRFSCGVLMAGERLARAAGTCPGAQVEKGRRDLKINTFHGELEEEISSYEQYGRNFRPQSHNISSRNNTNLGQRKAIPLPRLVSDFLSNYLHIPLVPSQSGHLVLKDFFLL